MGGCIDALLIFDASKFSIVYVVNWSDMYVPSLGHFGINNAILMKFFVVDPHDFVIIDDERIVLLVKTKAQSFQKEVWNILTDLNKKMEPFQPY